MMDRIIWSFVRLAANWADPIVLTVMFVVVFYYWFR